MRMVLVKFNQCHMIWVIIHFRALKVTLPALCRITSYHISPNLQSNMRGKPVDAITGTCAHPWPQAEKQQKCGKDWGPKMFQRHEMLWTINCMGTWANPFANEESQWYAAIHAKMCQNPMSYILHTRWCSPYWGHTPVKLSQQMEILVQTFLQLIHVSCLKSKLPASWVTVLYAQET